MLITEASGSGSYNVTLDAAGTYIIKVVAVDKAGNSAYDTVEIIVKGAPEQPSISSVVVIGALVAIATTAVVVFYFVRRKTGESIEEQIV